MGQEFPTVADALGRDDKTCPQCGAEPLVRGRIALITQELMGEWARQQGVPKLNDEVQEEVHYWNAFASNHDGVLCTACGWNGYALSSDAGLQIGRHGYRMRVTSYVCDNCQPPHEFDRIDELAAHMQTAHGIGG